MGSNNNKNPSQKETQYGGANPGQSGGDPRGRVQNQIGYQSERFENQQGPMVQAFASNYGRGSESDYGNYTDIMNNYRDIYSGGGVSGAGGGSGGGGGGGGYSAFTVNPGTVNVERIGSRALNPLEKVAYKDPFKSYEGFTDFSQTGGFSPGDISNMRARGVSPIRAAYAAANRNIGQQRSLQGGYSPNAIAAQSQMAREQGQGMADATQNVEAEIARQRQAGRLAGLGGMAGIEGQRLGADVDLGKFNASQGLQANMFDVGNELDASKFNAGNELQAGMFNTNLNFQGQTYNADAQARAQAANNAAGEAAASRNAAAAAASNRDRLAALSGASNLYGTTPGQSQLFGNQLLQGVQSGGNFGLGIINAEGNAQQLPGAWDQTMGRIGQIGNIASNFAYPWLGDERQQQPRNTSGANPGGLPIGGGYNPFGNSGSGYGAGMGTPPYNSGYGGYQYPTSEGYGGVEYNPWGDQGPDEGWG